MAKRERERWLTFLHHPEFVDDARDLGFTLEDQRAVELQILRNPTAAPVMAGTGGLRKMRFAPPSWRTGKSGGTRVCYVLYAMFDTVLLVTVFSKSDRANLSPAGRRAAKEIVRVIAQELESRGSSAVE